MANTVEVTYNCLALIDAITAASHGVVRGWTPNPARNLVFADWAASMFAADDMEVQVQARPTALDFHGDLADLSGATTLVEPKPILAALKQGKGPAAETVKVFFDGSSPKWVGLSVAGTDYQFAFPGEPGEFPTLEHYGFDYSDPGIISMSKDEIDFLLIKSGDEKPHHTVASFSEDEISAVDGVRSMTIIRKCHLQDGHVEIPKTALGIIKKMSVKNTEIYVKLDGLKHSISNGGMAAFTLETKSGARVDIFAKHDPCDFPTMGGLASSLASAQGIEFRKADILDLCRKVKPMTNNYWAGTPLFFGENQLTGRHDNPDLGTVQSLNIPYQHGEITGGGTEPIETILNLSLLEEMVKKFPCKDDENITLSVANGLKPVRLQWGRYIAYIMRIKE